MAIKISMDEAFIAIEERQKKIMKENGYYIHSIINGYVDSVSGNVINNCKRWMCNVHTHGFMESFNHKDIRIVSNYGIGLSDITKIIDTIANAIKKGSPQFDVWEGSGIPPILYCIDEQKFFLIKDIDEPDSIIRLIRSNIPNNIFNKQFWPLKNIYLKEDLTEE